MTKEYMQKMGAMFKSLVTLVTKIMNKPLKIATWNANELAKHSQEIKIFIFSQNIDILLVSKTHFRNKNYCRVPGYILYHTGAPYGKAHGGTALIIRSNIKHYEIGKFQNFSCRNFCRLLA